MVNYQVREMGKLAECELNGDLNLLALPWIREVFWKGLSEVDELHIVFGDVSIVDLSFLQLLCSAHRTYEEKGKKLTLPRELPPTVMDMIKRSGFSRVKGCPHDRNNTCLWLREV